MISIPKKYMQLLFNQHHNQFCGLYHFTQSSVHYNADGIIFIVWARY